MSLFVELAVFAADVLCVDIVYQLQASLYLPVKFDISLAVSSVPEAVVALLSVRLLVVYKEHVFLTAVDIDVHCRAHGLLPYVPEDFIIGLPEVELRPGQRPELAEVELEGLSLIPEGAQEFPVQRDEVYLGLPSSDIEYAVFKLFSRQVAGKVVG